MSLTSIQSSIRQKFKELFPTITNEIQFGLVGGGCINETYRINFGNRQLFCKVNSATKFPQLFEKEANGLGLIAQQNVIKVPGVIDRFDTNGQQVLLLEWINERERNESFWKKFGEQLAELHQIANGYFGLDEDNYMGSILQSNQQSGNWIDFFIRQRLQPLTNKCLSQKLLNPKHQIQFECLYKQLPVIFDKEQKPSLLHGDLWSGNFMCDQDHDPVLIDPAVYYGHPSIDLGMTTLFGGFHSIFYEAYHYHSPFPSNYKEQWEVCNLYPLLIHLLLFGRSYLSQIERILNQYN
jgi:protein-ribulosamine 3-kinase